MDCDSLISQVESLIQTSDDTYWYKQYQFLIDLAPLNEIQNLDEDKSKKLINLIFAYTIIVISRFSDDILKARSSKFCLYSYSMFVRFINKIFGLTNSYFTATISKGSYITSLYIKVIVPNTDKVRYYYWNGNGFVQVKKETFDLQDTYSNENTSDHLNLIPLTTQNGE